MDDRSPAPLPGAASEARIHADLIPLLDEDELRYVLAANHVDHSHFRSREALLEALQTCPDISILR
jgi:hypothetical protein